MNTDKWGTPQYIIDMVDQAFRHTGWHDPFPADWHPDTHPCATSYEWTKPVFCNPPYSRGSLDFFLDHAIKQDVPQIWLVKGVMTSSKPGAGWLNRMMQHFNQLCIIDHRIAHVNPETGKPSQANNFPSFLLGIGCLYFNKAFNELGWCVTIQGSQQKLRKFAVKPH